MITDSTILITGATSGIGLGLARARQANGNPLILTGDGRVVALVEIADLADSNGITTYDAAYLELAIRLNCPLATQDKALAKAASRFGFLYA